MIFALILYALIATLVAVYFARIARRRRLEAYNESGRVNSIWHLYTESDRARREAERKLALAERPWLAPPSWERDL